MMHAHLPGPARASIDGLAAATTVTALLWASLPKIALLLTIIWTLLQICAHPLTHKIASRIRRAFSPGQKDPPNVDV